MEEREPELVIGLVAETELDQGAVGREPTGCPTQVSATKLAGVRTMMTPVAAARSFAPSMISGGSRRVSFRNSTRRSRGGLGIEGVGMDSCSLNLTPPSHAIGSGCSRKRSATSGTSRGGTSHPPLPRRRIADAEIGEEGGDLAGLAPRAALGYQAMSHQVACWEVLRPVGRTRALALLERERGALGTASPSHSTVGQRCQACGSSWIDVSGVMAALLLTISLIVFTGRSMRRASSDCDIPRLSQRLGENLSGCNGPVRLPNRLLICHGNQPPL